MTTTRVRTAVLGVVMALALPLLGACADDETTPATDPAPRPAAGTESPTAGGIEHPTGPDDVVLRIEEGGGLVPVEYAFTGQPSLLLTGDGRLLVPSPDRGDDLRRLLALQAAQLSEEQVQELVTLADDAGLLASPPDYTDTGGPQVTDAPTTAVVLSAAGGTWVHEAYALSFGDDTDADGPRQALRDFIEAATAAVTDVELVPFVPDELALLAEPTDAGRRPQPWPVDEIELATTGGCAVVPADGLVEVLVDSDLTTTFRQGDVTYGVSARAVLPGDTDPCP